MKDAAYMDEIFRKHGPFNYVYHLAAIPVLFALHTSLAKGGKGFVLMSEVALGPLFLN